MHISDEEAQNQITTLLCSTQTIRDSERLETDSERERDLELQQLTVKTGVKQVCQDQIWPFGWTSWKT